jgi:hypothetical protein
MATTLSNEQLLGLGLAGVAVWWAVKNYDGKVLGGGDTPPPQGDTLSAPPRQRGGQTTSVQEVDDVVLVGDDFPLLKDNEPPRESARRDAAFN